VLKPNNIKISTVKILNKALFEWKMYSNWDNGIIA
jgi:hypothetical protein